MIKCKFHFRTHRNIPNYINIILNCLKYLLIKSELMILTNFIFQEPFIIYILYQFSVLNILLTKTNVLYYGQKLPKTYFHLKCFDYAVKNNREMFILRKGQHCFLLLAWMLTFKCTFLFIVTFFFF